MCIDHASPLEILFYTRTWAFTARVLGLISCGFRCPKRSFIFLFWSNFFLQCIIFLVDVWNARKRAFSADHAKYQWNRRHLHLLSIPGVTPYIHRAFLSHPFSLVPPPPEDIRQQLPSWDPGGSLGGSALRQRNLLKAVWMFSREARCVTPPRVTFVASL